MPTEEDIDDMIKKCRNPRDKFWVAWTGLDSAVRPCENRALKWCDLSKDKHGYFFTIKTAKESGDTENRSIRVINSEPYLFDWMKNYPGKREDDEFVFCHLDNPGIPLDEGAITSLFKRLKKRINFKGKFSAYTLRHVCLTRLSKNPDVAIPILKKMAGHSKNSNVIAEYQHFGDEDVLEMNLVASGKKDVKRDFNLKINRFVALIVKLLILMMRRFVVKCNFALSQKRVVNNEDLQKKVLELTEKIDGLLDGGYEKEMGKIYEQFEKKRKEKAK